MWRRGVVVLSAEPSAAAFVNDILAEMVPTERRTIRVHCGRTCIAAVGPPGRRRLLLVDGEPPDLSAGVLIESVKMSDPQLPIVFVRRGWDRPPLIHNGVRVLPGPFVSRPVQALIIELLASAGRR
jgi:hypothetical protein